MELKINWLIDYVVDQHGPYGHLVNAHTHGMDDYLHMDFQVVLNFPTKHICYLLNTMGMRVQAGESFHDGDMVSGLHEDCDVRLKQCRETGRGVLRLVIPDKCNHFPENAECMEPYKYQELPMFEE
jgi:hypothetical protein